jgi:hypothetical protein
MKSTPSFDSVSHFIFVAREAVVKIDTEYYKAEYMLFKVIKHPLSKK